jgi:GLPGLI family protein
MKRLIIVLFIIFAAGNVFTQDFKGGVVKYQYIKKYNWKSTFGEFKDREAQEWVTSLPRERQMSQVLYFAEEKSLFKEDPSDITPLPKKLQAAIMKSAYVQPPNPELKKVYCDFGKNKITRQMEFMTRNFLVTDQIDRLAWKLTNKKIKVQDYICLSSELKKGDDKITAWFTSEIPVSAGPGEFYGLPGLILAVEVNGETIFLAKSVELNPPKNGELSKPDDGKKVTSKEFDKIIAMKIKEYNEMQKAKGAKKKKK